MNSSNRRLVLKHLAAAATALTMGSMAFGQALINKPVTLMVPYPPGGASDALARMINVKLAKDLGQTVLVENLGGASGAIAAQKVLSAPADGQYIFVGSPNEVILSPLANAAVKFKSEEFRLIQMVGDFRMAIYGRGDLPASNADELVAYAAKRAKEGNPLTYGSVGNGTIYHLLGEQMSRMTGVPMTHVPYKGGGPMNQDLLGGMIDIFIGGYNPATIENVKKGRLKFFPSMGQERFEDLKQVQSVQESKQLKDFIYPFWIGLFVKKDTPEPIVQRLHQLLTEQMKDPAIRNSLDINSIKASNAMSQAETDKAYTSGIEKFRSIARSINLQPL